MRGLNRSPCVDGSRSSIWCRRSSSDRLTPEVCVRPPFCMAAIGLSSRRLDTEAADRMSSSPSFPMSRIRSANAWLWTSSDITVSRYPDTMSSSFVAVRVRDGDRPGRLGRRDRRHGGRRLQDERRGRRSGVRRMGLCTRHCRGRRQFEWLVGHDWLLLCARIRRARASGLPPRPLSPTFRGCEPAPVQRPAPSPARCPQASRAVPGTGPGEGRRRGTARG